MDAWFLVRVGLIVVASLIVLWSMVWPIAKAVWGKFWPTWVTGAGDKLSAMTDELTAVTALLPVAFLAKKRQDTKAMQLLRDLRQQIATWDDAFTLTPPPPSP